MKSIKNITLFSSLLLLSLFLASCVTDSPSSKQDSPLALEQDDTQPLEPSVTTPIATIPVSLPVRYQTASYLVDLDEREDVSIAEESKLKVGARISSTRGPQPLWDILKRLASLKNMNVSWASDVDKYVLVDVDISANDDFYEAIDNMLRQVDYFHEMSGTTIVVSYKDTRRFHIAMPYTKKLFETATGGNVLGSSEAASNIEGTIRLDSRGNEFDIWENIKLNLDTIMDKWSYRRAAADTVKGTTATTGVGRDASRRFQSGEEEGLTGQTSQTNATEIITETGHLQKTAGLGYYIIDQHLGLITVTAPRPILEKVENYITTLEKSIYKQISIEAKILEVHLDSHSSIGLDWNMLLKNLSFAGGALTGRKTYSDSTTDTTDSLSSWDRTNINSNVSDRTRDRSYDNTLDDSLTGDTGTHNFTGLVSDVANSFASGGVSAATIITNGVTGGLVGGISLAAFTFDSFLNAVKEQGQTTILANPKLSVLNGQPALITVGRNVTYIDSIESDVNNDTGTISYTVETARVLSGVGLALTANILNDNEIILNLVPVTSELQEPIEYRQVGLGEVGLPIINIREISTTVRVKDGEMLVIGGLISSIDEEDGTFLPGTSNIPFFKYLFGYEEKTSRKRELIILLRPRIM